MKNVLIFLNITTGEKHHFFLRVLSKHKYKEVFYVHLILSLYFQMRKTSIVKVLLMLFIIEVFVNIFNKIKISLAFSFFINFILK